MPFISITTQRRALGVLVLTAVLATVACRKNPAKFTPVPTPVPTPTPAFTATFAVWPHMHKHVHSIELDRMVIEPREGAVDGDGYKTYQPGRPVYGNITFRTSCTAEALADAKEFVKRAKTDWRPVVIDRQFPPRTYRITPAGVVSFEEDSSFENSFDCSYAITLKVERVQIESKETVVVPEDDVAEDWNVRTKTGHKITFDDNKGVVRVAQAAGGAAITERLTRGRKSKSFENMKVSDIVTDRSHVLIDWINNPTTVRDITIEARNSAHELTHVVQQRGVLITEVTFPKFSTLPGDAANAAATETVIFRPHRGEVK